MGLRWRGNLSPAEVRLFFRKNPEHACYIYSCHAECRGKVIMWNGKDRRDVWGEQELTRVDVALSAMKAHTIVTLCPAIRRGRTFWARGLY